MANDARRVSQLTVTTSLSANDRLVVLTNPASSAKTQTITANNFIKYASNNFPIANTSQRGLVQVDGNTIVAAANGMLSINTSYQPTNLINKTTLGSNNNVDSTNYMTNAVELDVTKQVQYLVSNGDSGEIHFYLPPAANGHVMYFTPQSSQHMDNLFIWVDNAREFNSTILLSPAKWRPFYNGDDNMMMSVGVYIDGAWNFDRNTFN